jgi:hypothetical protein
MLCLREQLIASLLPSFDRGTSGIVDWPTIHNGNPFFLDIIIDRNTVIILGSFSSSSILLLRPLLIPSEIYNQIGFYRAGNVHHTTNLSRSSFQCQE